MQQYISHIPPFEQARVLVVGDVMLDRYWTGDTSRVSPEAPVPVVHIQDRQERPGGAANVALNVRSLGASATVLGIVGEDDAAHTLRQLLSAADVRSDLIALDAVTTVTKLRIMSRHQQLIRLDFEDGYVSSGGDVLLAQLQHALADADVVVLSDYGKGTLHQVQQLIDAARAQNTPVFVDPKGRDFARYQGATVLTPNLSEFENIMGRCTDEADMAEKARSLCEALQLQALLITRGEQGMSLFTRDAAGRHFPANAREVFDVTGAGDTVIAVLASAMAAEQDLAAAAALANLAAGLVVGKLGAASITAAELKRALHDRDEGDKVVDEETLPSLVTDARRRGERIVMTNGCFDILHAGHVAYLAQARALGDRLIVAVNDDASVTRIKGGDRPVVPLAQRMQVLAGLAAVDWVVPFSEDTPARLIERVSPDVLAKGGDYAPQQVAGYDHVMSYGGEVVIVDYAQGQSSSAIIEAIHKG